MITQQKEILAIDFGTTNTYLATGHPETGKVEPVNIVVQVKQMGRGLSTAILFSDSSTPTLGDRAVNWFYTASEEERQTYQFRLSSHFKPDIARYAQSRADAVAFLREILALAAKNHLQLEPQQMEVFFGVPCQAGEEYKKTLREIAKEAGFGEVSLLEEPYGALFYHEGDNNIKDILRSSVFVIDFGGGTCDFTLLRDGQIVGGNGWGDMNLGGRLFDDLFFQWFEEQNPEQAKRIKEQKLDFFVRTQLCREAKEEFSVDMIANRNQRVIPREIGRFGMINNMSLAEFERRARNYSPSYSLRQQLEQQRTATNESMDGSLVQRLSEGSVDIIQWFMTTMESGFHRSYVRPDDVDVILLAGGSSAWYFVVDCCIKLFGKEETDKKIRLSRNVFAAIAEGIVKYRFLCERAASQREKLRRDLPEFAERLAKRITRELTIRNNFKEEASGLFRSNIRPHLIQFQQNGGTIRDLRESLKTAISENEFSGTIMKKIEKNVQVLLPTIENEIQEWFRRHGVNPDRIQTQRMDIRGFTPENLGGNLFDLSSLSLVATTIGSIIVANILGGGGIALLMGGPLGLIIGFILSFAIFHRFSEQLLEKVSIPRWLTNKWFTDKKIDSEMQESFIEGFQKVVSETYQRENDNIIAIWQKQLIDVVQREINYLERIDLIQHGTFQ